MQIMKTDGGPHSAAYWASAMAKELVADPSPNASQSDRDAIEAVRSALVSVVEPLYVAMLSDEGLKLNSDPERLLKGITPTDVMVDDWVAQISATTDGTAYAAHFRSDRVQDYLKRVVRQHVVTARDVARGWFADDYKGDPDLVQAYRTAKAKHGVLAVPRHAGKYRGKAPATPTPQN